MSKKGQWGKGFTGLFVDIGTKRKHLQQLIRMLFKIISCQVYLCHETLGVQCICVSVDLCICVRCICLFVDFPGKRKQAEQLRSRLFKITSCQVATLCSLLLWKLWFFEIFLPRGNRVFCSSGKAVICEKSNKSCERKIFTNLWFVLKKFPIHIRLRIVTPQKPRTQKLPTPAHGSHQCSIVLVLHQLKTKPSVNVVETFRSVILSPHNSWKGRGWFCPRPGASDQTNPTQALGGAVSGGRMEGQIFFCQIRGSCRCYGPAFDWACGRRSIDQWSVGGLESHRLPAKNARRVWVVMGGYRAPRATPAHPR